jgi:hypothetical protein
MSWTETHVFVDPMLDLRSEPERARVLAAELERELGPSHELFGRPWTVVAEAMPQDDVLVQLGDLTYLVHLTWSGHAEEAPWRAAERVDSADEFERVVEFRY